MSGPAAAADQVTRPGGASPAGPGGGFADNDPSSIQHQRRKKRHVPTPSTLLRAALQADSEQGLMEVLGRCGKEYLMIASRLLVSVLMRKWGYTLFAGYKKLQSEECYGEHVLTNGKANKNSILPIGSLLKHYILIRKMDDAFVAARRKAANAAATSKKVPAAVVIRGPKKIARPRTTTSRSAEVEVNLSCIPLVVVEDETTKSMQEGEGAPGGKNYSAANNSCNYLSTYLSRALVTTSRARAAGGARTTSSASNLPPLSLEDYDFIQRYRDQLTDGEKARVGFWFREFWQSPTGEREMRDSKWRCKSYLEIVLHFKPLWHTCVLPGEDAVPVAQKLKPGALVGLVALAESALGVVEVENRGKFGARRGGEMVRTNSSSRMEARAIGGPEESDKTGGSAENENSSAVAGGTDSLSTSPQDEPQEKISQVEPDPEVQTEKITVRGRNDLIRLLLETYVDTNGDGTEFVLEVAEASKYTNNRSEQDTSAVRTQQQANPICLRELLKTYDGFFASAAAGPEKLQTWVASAILMGELDTGGLRLQPSTVKRVTTILASHVQQLGGLRTDQQVRHLTTFLRGCLETSKVSLASNMMAQNLERLMQLVFALPKTAAENMSFANPGQVGAAGMFGGHTPFGAGVERNVREHTLSGVSQYFVTTTSTRFLASCVAMVPVPQLQDDPGVPAGASTQGDVLKEDNGKTIVVGIKTYRLFLENLLARNVEDFSMKIFHLYIGRIALNERRKIGKFGLYGRQFREKLFRWTTAQLDRYGNHTTTAGRTAIGLDDFHADVVPTSKHAAQFFAEVIVGYCAPAQIGRIWLQMVDLFESWEFLEATWAFLAAEDTQEHLHFAADWKRPLDRGHYVVGAVVGEDEARSSGDPEVASLRQVVFDRVVLQLEREMAVSVSHRAGLDPTTYARVMARLRGYHPALFAEKFGAKPYVRWGQRAERPPGRASGCEITNVDIRPLSALTSEDLKQLPAAQITGRFCAAEKYFCAVLREHFPKIAKLKQKDDFQLVTNWLTLLPPHVFLCPEVVDKMSSILYARWSAKPQLQRLCHVFLVKTVIAGLLQAQFFLAELFGGAAEAFMAAVDTEDKKIRFLLSHFDRVARFTLKCGNFDLASTAPAAASGLGGQHQQLSTTTKAQFLATKVFVPEWKTGGSYQHGSGLTGTGTAPVKLPSDDILLLLLFPLIKANARKAVDVVEMLHALNIDEVKHEGTARLFYALLEGDGSAAGPGGGSAGGDRVDAAEPKTPSASSVPLRGEEVGGRAAAGSSILSPSFVDLGRELDVSSVATRQLDVGGGGAATSGGAWDLLGGGDGHDHEDEQDTGGLEGEDTAGAMTAPLESAAVVAPAAAFSEVGLSPKFLTRFEQLKVMRSCKFGFFHAYSSYVDRDECVEADFSFWAELEEEALTGTSSSAPAPAPPGTEVDDEPDLAFLRRFGAQGLAVFEDFLRAATPAQLVDLLENDARKFFRKAATKLILEQWNPICPVGQEDDLLTLITKVLPELLPGCLPVLLDRLENAVFTPISSALNAEEKAFHEERQQTAVRIAKAALNELKELPNSAEFVLVPAKWWVYLNPLKIIDNFAHKFGARSSSGASACSATTATSSDSGVGEVDSENDVEDEIQNTSEDAHEDGTSPKSIDSLILTLLHHGAVIDPRKLLELPVIQPTVGGNKFSVTHANLFTAVTEQTTLSQLKVNCFGVLQPGTQLRLLKAWESNAEMYVNILAKCVPRMADQIDGFFYEIFDLLERISTYTSMFTLGDGASTQEILKSGWNKIVYTLLTSLRDRVRVDENVLHSEEQLVLFGCLSGQGKKLDSTNTTVLSDFLDAKYVDKKHIFALVHYVLSPAADFSKTIREAALRALLRLEQNDRDTLIQTLLERAGKDKLPLEVLFALCVTQLHDDNPSKPLIVAQLQRLEDGEWDTLVEQIADANPSKPDAYMHTAPRSLGDHFADRFLLRYLRGFLSQNHTTKAALSMPSRAWAQKWCKNAGGSTSTAGTSAGRKQYSVEEQKTAKLKKYTHDGRIFWLFVACERKERIAGVLLSLLKRQLHSLTEEWLRALAPTVAKVDPVSGAKGEQQNVILSMEEVADYVHFIPHRVWAQTQQSRTGVSDYRQWLFAQIVAGGTRHMLKTKMKINCVSGSSTSVSTAAFGVAYEELVCDRLAVVIDYWKKGSANGGSIDLKQQLLTVINHTLDREKLVRIAEDFHSEPVLRILEGPPHAEMKTSSEGAGSTAMSGKQQQGQGTTSKSKSKAVVVGSASTLKHSLFLQMPLTRALIKRQLFEVNDRGCWLAFFQQSFAVYGSHLGSGAPILDFLEPPASRGVDKNRQEDGFAFSGKAPDLAERGFIELLECLPEVFDLFPACSDPAKAAVAKLQKASVVDAGNQTWRAQRMATRKAGLVAEEKMGTVGGGKKNTGSCFEDEEEFVLVTEDASSPPSTSTFLAYSAYSHAKQPTTRHHFQPLQKSEIERLGSTGIVAKTLLTWVAPTTALPLFGVQLLKAKPTFARTLTDAEFSLLDLKSALVGSFGRWEENWPLCRQLLCLQNGYLSAQRALPLALALLKRTNESEDVERLRELYLMKRDQVVTLDAGISAFHRRALGLRQELDGAVWQKFGARIQATMIDQAEQGEDRGSAAVAGAAAPAGTGGASRKTESLFATIMLDDILILEEPEKPPQPQVVGTGTGGQGQGTQSRNESGVDSESSTSVADEEKGAVGGKKGK